MNPPQMEVAAGSSSRQSGNGNWSAAV